LAVNGASRVYVADDERLARYSTFDYTTLVADAIKTHNPMTVLLGSTSNGRDLAPRIAARLSLGLTADCIDVDLDERGELIQYKPAFGGNIVALIYSKTLPQIATVKPGMLRAAQADESGNAEVIRLEIPPGQDRRARLIEVRREVSFEVAELDEASRVICVGTGIGGPENLAAIEEMARALDARIGATRRVVDHGWLPRHQQIGLTGKVISPALYIAIGVRGALQPPIGIQQAGTIVAINNDPEAEIFHTSDFGIVDDWREIVPALTEKLEAIRSRSS